MKCLSNKREIRWTRSGAFVGTRNPSGALLWEHGMRYGNPHQQNKNDRGHHSSDDPLFPFVIPNYTGLDCRCLQLQNDNQQPWHTVSRERNNNFVKRTQQGNVLVEMIIRRWSALLRRNVRHENAARFSFPYLMEHDITSALRSHWTWTSGIDIPGRHR